MFELLLERDGASSSICCCQPAIRCRPTDETTGGGMIEDEQTRMNH